MCRPVSACCVRTVRRSRHPCTPCGSRPTRPVGIESQRSASRATSTRSSRSCTPRRSAHWRRATFLPHTKKLEAIVAVDSGFKSASSQLAEVRQGAGGSTTTTSGASAGGSSGSKSPGTTKPGEAAKPEGPVASLLRYTPDTLPGFKALPVVADTFSLSREYRATGSGALTALVIAVEQHGSPKVRRGLAQDGRQARIHRAPRTVRVGSRKRLRCHRREALRHRRMDGRPGCDRDRGRGVG